MNMKLLLSLTLILMGALLKAAPSTETKIRVTEDFNMGWKFLLGDSPERREINYDDSQWRTLNLPHDWSIEGDYTPDFPAGKKQRFLPRGIRMVQKNLHCRQRRFKQTVCNSVRRCIYEFRSVD